jgi:N-acetylated-alpha-linked acidic dipeptidase
MDYTDYAAEIRTFITETQRVAARRKLDDSFDAKAMLAAAKDLMEEAERVNERRREALAELEKASARGGDAGGRAGERLRRLNDGLTAAERALTDARGLRGRAWYKHQIYAPGFYTGYAAQPLPDLRQAVDDRNTANAREAALRITEAIRRAVAALKKARE